MINNSSNINNLSKTQFLNKSDKNFVFKNNDLLVATVTKLVGKNALINIKGKTFFASSNVNLKQNDKVLVQVNGKVDNKPNLKVINNFSNESANFFKNNNIAFTDKNIMVYNFLKENSMPLNQKSMFDLSNVLSKLGPDVSNNLKLISQFFENLNSFENINEQALNLLKMAIFNKDLTKDINKLLKHFKDDKNLTKTLSLLDKLLITDDKDLKDKIKKQLKELGFDLENRFKNVGDEKDKENLKDNIKHNLNNFLKENSDIDEKSSNKEKILFKLIKDISENLLSKEIISKMSKDIINFELLFSENFEINRANIVIVKDKENKKKKQDENSNLLVVFDLNLSKLEDIKIYLNKKDNLLELTFYLNSIDKKEFLENDIQNLKKINFKSDIKISLINVIVDEEKIKENFLENYYNLDKNSNLEKNFEKHNLDLKI